MKIKIKWKQYDVLQHVYENVHAVRIDPNQGTIHLFNKVNYPIDDGPLAETSNIEIEDENPSSAEELVKLNKIAEMEAERALHYRTMWQQAIQSNHQLRVGELTREVALLKEALEKTKLTAIERDEQAIQLNTSLRNKIYQLNETVEELTAKNTFLSDFIQKKKTSNNSDQCWDEKHW